MTQFNWSFEKASSASPFGFYLIDLSDPSASWVFFFTGVFLDDYPEVVELAAREVGSSFNSVGLFFPADLDDDDLISRDPIPADAVEIYHNDFGTTIIPRTVFYEVLEEFAQRLVEQPGHPIAWYDSMQAALAKLRAKMAADAAE